eukprot:3168999-Heterocapsa_arctica.AAC.1
MIPPQCCTWALPAVAPLSPQKYPGEGLPRLVRPGAALPEQASPVVLVQPAWLRSRSGLPSPTAC